MKQFIFGILFTTLYLVAMLRPLLPVLEYYANYDYIANELCENRDKPYLECNGSCYLEEQMSKVNPLGENHQPATIPFINLKDYPISTLDFFGYQFSDFESESDTSLIIAYEKPYFFEWYSDIFHPPLV
jgi:hypothetical protein